MFTTVSVLGIVLAIIFIYWMHKAQAKDNKKANALQKGEIHDHAKD